MKTREHKITETRKQGFTLIETLVAVSILTLSVAGPLSVAARGLISASFARDQITAYYLAQEAMELVRNQRDRNTLTGASDWNGGMDACFGADGCYVDASSEDPAFAACSGSVCPLLYRSQASGFYSYHTGEGMMQTQFVRRLSMKDVSADEFSVSVTVSWKTGPLSKSFTIQDNFLNWQ